MALSEGSWLNHYEILGHLGTGGMGEVYRARDNKLQREVALKVLPKAFAQDPERVARFRREAQVLAQVNHPNIAAIYSVEESGGTHFLVMELAEGETIRDRIKRGAIPIEEALDIAKQIAAGLEAAHEKPIVHRDLKPANVKVTPEGVVKILDFGLARAFAGETGSGDPSDSPTLTGMTQPGTILGTAAYMSPEQARGKTVDKRTDIWALGCVLYEMLTGKRAFPGETVTDILAKVLEGDPDWSALPQTTPPGIIAVLRRCLRRDVQQRSRDAADIRLEIDDARFASPHELPPVAAQANALAPRRWLLFSALACLLVAVMAAASAWILKPVPSRPIERLESTLPAATRLVQSNVTLFALSPDGSRLAYVAVETGSTPQLYLRQMGAIEAAPLAGTEGASNPFFSPDGQWIGFVTGGLLKKISASGGTAFVLCPDAGTPTGADWGPDDTIVFSPGAGTGGLQKVPAAGGDPQPFTRVQQGETRHLWPQFLPDGKTVLFTTGLPTGSRIVAQRLDSEERKVLVQGGTFGRYVPTGHLIYYRAGTIMAVPFDPVTLDVKGSPSPVMQNVMGNTISGVAQFAVSNPGSLAYLPGGPTSVNQTMVWVDHQGAATPLPALPRPYRAPRVSPDGR